MLFSITLKQLHLIEQIKYWYVIDSFVLSCEKCQNPSKSHLIQELENTLISR